MKPDIILTNLQTQKRIIFDVKYKDYTNKKYSREYRLQLLAYSMMYNADDIGIIFPKNKDGQDEFFESRRVNSLENRTISYHQFLLDFQQNNNLIEHIKNCIK